MPFIGHTCYSLPLKGTTEKKKLDELFLEGINDFYDVFGNFYIFLYFFFCS